MFKTERLIPILQHIYLFYLGLLPAVATFAILAIYGHPAPFFVFIGGVMEVGVYLAVVANYVRVPQSVWGCLLVLLDGPGWVLMSLLRGGNPLAYPIESFLVEGLVILAVILWLSLTTPLIKGRERIMPVVFMLFAILVALSLFWPYLHDEVLTDGWKVLLLSLGAIQAVGMHFYVLKRDVMARNPDDSIGFILILLILWIIAMFAGNILGKMHPSWSF